ncbi:hypothetical protein N7486_005154 [Penicillium sp. IBT 16267x]|nr:hypothetical protein N7486_005154 [Penicillium sp. IBT 16267x]
MPSLPIDKMHRTTTAAKVLTERYISGHTRELYNERAANQAKRHRREPLFSSQSAIEVVNAPISKQEVQAWEEDHEGRHITIKAIHQDIRQRRLKA